MQDIDFSQNTSYRPAELSLPEQSGNSHKAAPSKKNSGFFFTLLSVIALLSFSLGLISGFFLAKAKNIEKNIISRPDETHFRSAGSQARAKDNFRSRLPSHRSLEKKANPRSFTNVSDSLRKEAPFLIKVGVYPAQKAQSIARRLNRLPEFLGSLAYKCKNIKRPPPFSLKQISFTVPVSGIPQQENVLLGCFMKKNKAIAFLTKTLRAKIPETQSAQLFQVTE